MAPGLAIVAIIAAVALGSGSIVPPVVSAVLVAVVVGMVVGNVWTLPASTGPGIEFALKTLLRLGIVLLGARLSMGEVLSVGLRSLWPIVVCMSVAFATILAGARLARASSQLAVLLAVGTAICGNTAIIATAPVVGAKKREISYAVATITLFGTAALLIYPWIGHSVDMADVTFGYWSGLAVNDTSQVVATGAAYSAEALEVATVVKLVRNTLMAPILVVLAWIFMRRGGPQPGSTRTGVLKAFPSFVLGFLVVSALRSIGVIDAGTAEVLAGISTILITMAVAGIGLTTKISRFRRVGPMPFLLGIIGAVATSGAALILAFVVT